MKAGNQTTGAARPKQTKENKSFGFSDLAKIVVSAIVIAFLITQFVMNATVVEGSSMMDTLHNHDRLFVWKLGVGTKSLKRGDIVVFRAPDDPGKDYIKRVVGLPGEFVQIKDGRVYINGDRLEEPYINVEYTHVGKTHEWYVGEDQIFVLGDNRKEGASRDSRVFGPISGDRLVGMAVFRFYPFDAFGGL